MIMQNLFSWLLAHKASVFSSCFPAIARLASLRLLSTSGAAQNSVGIRAAQGLAPYCYTAVALFLFQRNRGSVLLRCRAESN
jgi:hypothetical protein